MKKVLLTGSIAVTTLLFVGCSGANVHNQIRVNDTTSMETRCIELDTRSTGKMDKALAKYDGWRVFYVSEYTTPNKTSVSGVMCFERPAQ